MNLIFIIILSIVAAFYAYIKFKLNYWESKGVKQLQSSGFWENVAKLTDMHHTELLQEVYDGFKGKVKLAGTYVYTRPIAVAVHLDVVKLVLIKDFNYFVDRFESSKDTLSQHLFRVDAQTWRGLRNKLTSTFTSGKMKFMFPNMVQVAEKFSLAFEEEIKRSPEQCVEMHDMNARFTTDVIGSCVFGVDCNCLKDPNVEFRQMGRKIFGSLISSIKLSLVKFTYMKFLRNFGFRSFPKDVELFFLRIVRETVLEREKQNIHRNDFIDLLIDLKNQKDDKGKPLLSLELLTAQLFVFFAAGFETSSSNMSYALYELAKQPQKQEKLRQEIVEILKKHNNELSYEAIMEMSYLDQVITETLRLYPALGFLQRICIDDYKLPESDITLEKGTMIFIPVKSIHYDPEIYENPYEFQPERFDAAELQKRHPQAFLGFGDGPRNCIGLRFGRMQVKVGLITLLLKYKFSFSKRTPQELEISKNSLVRVPAKGVWLRVDKL